MVSASIVARMFSTSPGAALPLLPIAPAIVVVVGITTAVVIALLGISQLQATSDDGATLRADALSATLAARLGPTASEDRADILGRAARRSAAEILLVDREGQILVNESFEKLPRDEVQRLLAAADGETRTALGRVRFAARPLAPPRANLAVVTFVAAPRPPPGTVALVNSVAALTALLLGIAVTVSLAYAKAARDDVEYVRRRIVAMARPDGSPAGEPIPIRSLDQVGALTAACNLLVGRFAAAERSYRADLHQAAEGAKERSVFLAGLSHELRTPLNAILGFTHVLETEVDGPLDEESHDSLQIIKTSGEHLKTLIDDVLDLSALETGQLKLNRRPVDVRELCEEVVREARAYVRDKPVGLAVTGEAGLYANADAHRVRQVLTNLLSNAIKATTQGWVTVHVESRPFATSATGEGAPDDITPPPPDRGGEPSAGYVALVVQDTGAGIPPEQRAAIFEAYRQAGDLRTRRGGVGLGLSIAQRLVGMHGGTIEVESQVGRGSRFTVCLPRIDDGERRELTARPDSTFPSGNWTKRLPR
jgi:signal transduction histidine kinase